MDINEKLMQINTFTGGMDTDSPDAMIDTTKYRYAENLRMLADNNPNNGELHMIQGSSELINSLPLDCLVKKILTCRNIIVIIVTSQDTWSVYRSTYDTASKTASNPKLVFGPCRNYDISDKEISATCRYETEKNVKLYMADGEHDMFVINVLSSITPVPTDVSKFASVSPIIAPIVQISDNVGSLKAAKVQYAVKFYSDDGFSTKISPLSKIVSLYGDDKGYAQKQITSKACDITIQLPENTLYNKYVLYRINYIQNGQSPEVTIIYDRYYDKSKAGSSLPITDDGWHVVSQVSISDFIKQLNYVDIIPTTIESKNNYLFAGNVSYKQDTIDDKFKNIDLRTFSSGHRQNGNSIPWINGHPIIGDETQHPLSHNGLIDDQWRSEDWYMLGTTQLYGGAGFYVRWTYIINGVDINTFGESSSSSNPYGVVSFRRGEVYRFGAILRDADGNASSVKYIADIKIPRYIEIPTFSVVGHKVGGTSTDPFTENGITHVQLIGIKFYIDPIPGCSSIEIVRCIRTTNDKYCLGSGIVSRPLLLFVKDTEKTNICPSGYMSLQPINVSGRTLDDDTNTNEWRRHASSISNIIEFSSPEYCYQADDVRSLLKNYETTNTLRLRYDTTYGCESVAGNMQKRFTTYGDLNQDHTYKLDSNYIRLLCGETSGNKRAPYLFLYKTAGDDANLNRRYSPTLHYISDSFDTINVDDQSDDVWKMVTTPTINYLFAYTTAPNGDNYNLGVEGIQRTEYKSRNQQYNDASHGRSRDGLIFYSLLFSAYDYNSVINRVKNTPTISNIQYVDVLGKTNVDNVFNTNGESRIKLLDESELIGNYTYIPFSAPLIQDNPNTNKTKDRYLGDNDSEARANPLSNREGLTDTWESGHYNRETVASIGKYDYPIGVAGKRILFELNEDLDIDLNYITSGYPVSNVLTSDSLITEASMPGGMLPITVMSIVKSALPYGGYDELAIKSSTYYSFGDIAKLNDDTTVEINVTSGDTYISNFLYASSMIFVSDRYDSMNKLCNICRVPIESDIDIQAQHGYIWNGNSFKAYDIQENATQFNDLNIYPNDTGIYNQDKDLYMYNTAYSQEPLFFPYYAKYETDYDRVRFDTRICYSEQKENGESFDSWTRFQAANYLDVDSKYGEITNLCSFNNKLIFWQQNATGVASVNEKTLLLSTNNTLIILGTGDVLDNYDYITKLYGMALNKKAYTNSDRVLYWWDDNRKELLSYTDNSLQVVSLFREKFIYSYFRDKVENTERPNLQYDAKYSEVLFSPNANITIVLNELYNAFSGIYTAGLLNTANIGEDVFVQNNENNAGIHIWNSTDDQDQDHVKIFNTDVYPKLLFVVNKSSAYNKVYDTQNIGGVLYEGSDLIQGAPNSDGLDVKKRYLDLQNYYHTNTPLHALSFVFTTPLKQEGRITGDQITNVEYDYRLVVPRAGWNNGNNWQSSNYGGRLKGKTMTCEITSSNSSPNFSLQYVTTKFRITP